MKNAILSVIIFFCLFCGIFLLNKSFLKLCDSIEHKTEEIESTLSNNDIQNSYNKSLELLQFIQDNHFIASIYVNHQDFDVIKYESVKLCIYISHNDINEADASLHLIKYEAQAVKHLQIPSFDNIF